MDVKLNNSIIEAVREIFGSIVGGDIRVVPDDKTAVTAPKYEISVIIGFAGKMAGTIILRCPKSLGLEVTGKMLGIAMTEDSAEMRDAIAELTNIIVCKAKSNYSDDRSAMSISAPSTIVGREYSLHTKADSEANISSLNFSHNGTMFNIIVYLK